MKTIFHLILLATLMAGPVAGDDLDTKLEDERTSQTATAISIIFDSSGSMSENEKLEQAKRAFSKWIASLPESYSLGLVYFNRGRGQLVVPLGEENRNEVAAAVASVRASGKTPIVQCLDIVRDEIEKRRLEFSPYERHVVVVFTDGIETVDRRGNRAVLDQIVALRSRMIEVVGIGFHGEGDYMRGTATTYFNANNEEELLAGLSQVDAEIGDDSDLEITKADLAMIEKTKIIAPPAPIPDKE